LEEFQGPRLGHAEDPICLGWIKPQEPRGKAGWKALFWACFQELQPGLLTAFATQKGENQRATRVAGPVPLAQWLTKLVGAVKEPGHRAARTLLGFLVNKGTRQVDRWVMKKLVKEEKRS